MQTMIISTTRVIGLHGKEKSHINSVYCDRIEKRQLQYVPAEASLASAGRSVPKSGRAGMFSVERVIQEMGHWFNDTRVTARTGLHKSIILVTSCS